MSRHVMLAVRSSGTQSTRAVPRLHVHGVTAALSLYVRLAGRGSPRDGVAAVIRMVS